jgi:hypothetical protein
VGDGGKMLNESDFGHYPSRQSVVATCDGRGGLVEAYIARDDERKRLELERSCDLISWYSLYVATSLAVSHSICACPTRIGYRSNSYYLIFPSPFLTTREMTRGAC